MHYIDSVTKKIYTRILLANIFYEHLVLGESQKPLIDSAPTWFQDLYISLKNTEAFTGNYNEVLNDFEKSREHICRCFKKYTGKTIIEFIKEQKLNYACNLLTNTNMSIMDISLQCGFENLSNFYAAFNKCLSISPMKFRKINKTESHTV